MLLPGSGFEVVGVTAFEPDWSADLVGATFQPYGVDSAGGSPFPYGLYLLEDEGRSPRVIRIYQQAAP